MEKKKTYVSILAGEFPFGLGAKGKNPVINMEKNPAVQCSGCPLALPPKLKKKKN